MECTKGFHLFIHTSTSRIRKKALHIPPRPKMLQSVFLYVLYHPHALLGSLGHPWDILDGTECFDVGN